MNIGDRVTVVVKTPFATVEEPDHVISDITDEFIKIEGLECEFGPLSGRMKDSFPGSSMFIKEINENYRKIITRKRPKWN